MTNTDSLFESMPDHARVWVYMADRNFSAVEVEEICVRISEFTSQWAAHGHALKADGACLFNRFVVLAVDEMAHGASGCSIDSSVKFIRELEATFQTNFFNRQLMAFAQQDDEVETIVFTALNESLAQGLLTDQTPVFNNLVGTVGELRSNWLKPLAESPYARLVQA